MATTLLKAYADIQLSLAAAVTVGQTTATLSSATDPDGVALPSGKYGFTVDGDTSAKEYIVCDLVGTALTGIQNVSRQGVTTTGFANYHRVGATVTITDWAILSRMLNNLNGTTGFDSATPVKYDAQPSFADPLTFASVQYVLDTVNGGTVTFNRQIISGDAGENISAGNWVYLNTTDGEWYKTDADDVAKCLGVQIGKAIGTGTDAQPIDGGIFVSGNETVGTYVAGTTYYISNTAGELSTSAGTNSVVVGVGDSNGDLILRKAAPSQVDAMQGGGDLGTPDTGNKFITQDWVTAKAPTAQTFNADGSYTPTSGAVYFRVQAWGAGGSGARFGGVATDEGGGGGGGGYSERWMTAADISAPVTVTIGIGGANRSNDGSGSTGGTTTFGSYLTAYGGGGGAQGGTGAGGGGGGGAIAAGAGGSGATGGAAGDVLSGAGGTGAVGSSSYQGAGGGGPANGGAGVNGGNSQWGGGGGGGTGTNAGSGGTSMLGGAGGAGNVSGSATAGSQPGGGGGASKNGTSGAGGDGRVTVTEFFI